MSLLHELAHCPNVRLCLTNPHLTHPCRKIVQSQGSPDLARFQVPEPWNGRLAKAPLLFVSSNPSISRDEMYPLGDWSDERIEDYFVKRFGGGSRVWVSDGGHWLKRDGSYAQPAVRFWVAIRARAKELLRRPAVRPGVDYALTEVVHCKSREEYGVEEALQECSRLWLRRVMAESSARVVIVLGARARLVVGKLLSVPERMSVFGPVVIGTRPRYFTWLPHPNSFQPKTFAKCLTADQLFTLREFLADSGR